MIKNEQIKIIEGLLFIKGEEGISINFLAEYLDVEKDVALDILDNFLEEYNKKDSALVVRKFGQKYKMLVKDYVFVDIKSKLETKKLTKLSKIALETLAIIAYNQPISKIEIDNIRGVNSESVVNSLLEKELIYSNKISDKIGKPKLYETTDLFLDIFGITSLDDLPPIEDENKKNEEELNDFLNN